MPRCVVRLGSQYCIWSTVVDAPVSPFVDRPELIPLLTQLAACIQAAALERLEETGSTHPCLTADDLIAGNRAGPGETCLSAEELVAQYSEEEGSDGNAVRV